MLVSILLFHGVRERDKQKARVGQREIQTETQHGVMMEGVAELNIIHQRKSLSSGALGTASNLA